MALGLIVVWLVEVADGLIVESVIMTTEGLIVGSFRDPQVSAGTLKHALPDGQPSPDGQRIDKSKQFA